MPESTSPLPAVASEEAPMGESHVRELLMATSVPGPFSTVMAPV